MWLLQWAMVALIFRMMWRLVDFAWDCFLDAWYYRDNDEEYDEDRRG
jgi:hypothetical protein